MTAKSWGGRDSARWCDPWTCRKALLRVGTNYHEQRKCGCLLVLEEIRI